eukprot:TRINITY_DN51156_c0_g1_i1.p1 TRINITY_DN51156_c0_g1~~TRINITY_DN51156_c0_g1_i1.p1  ORF type:complete len:180 (-),score=13.76 TRINITY_DN51156_c0_g1_i1:77-616(-)
MFSFSTMDDSKQELYELCVKNTFYEFRLVSIGDHRRTASVPDILSIGSAETHRAGMIRTRPHFEKTFMLRNIPCKIENDRVESSLREQGFAGTYDYLYLPRRSNGSNLGYCFVDILNPQDASRFETIFTGYSFPGSTKQCVVTLADIQGLEANLRANSRARRLRDALRENAGGATSITI